MLSDDEKLDASSRFQESLPVSSDELMRRLDEWGVIYKCFNHVPLSTVADSKLIQGQFLNKSEGGGHIKNLYLRDRRKNNFLIVSEQDRTIDLKMLKIKLETGGLSFGSSDRLMEKLGVRAGAVTPFSMITGIKKNVSLFLDAELKFCSKIYAHPLVNDRTIELSVENLELFFGKIGVVPNWIDF